MTGAYTPAYTKTFAGHQADNAHSAHPFIHPLHHGHRHPLRLLISNQAASGCQDVGGAARYIIECFNVV